MTWFKVDDNLAFHSKIISAGNAAVGLWVRAGSWCSQHLTDGFVPERVVKTLSSRGRSEARRLVEVGLWEEVEGGYHFHQWAERQPLRADVEVQREWDRRRMELHRDKELVAAIRTRDGDRCRYCGKQVRWNARRGPDAGTYDHVIPRGPNSLTNVVVACGPCNTSKGSRTPEAAGMALLSPRSISSEQDPVRSKNGLGSDQDPVPTRPDPTRPDPSSSRETRGGPSPLVTREAAPAPRCPQHAAAPAAGPCSACGDARRAHDAWAQARRDLTPVTFVPCPEHPDQPAGRCGPCAATSKPMPPGWRRSA